MDEKACCQFIISAHFQCHTVIANVILEFSNVYFYLFMHAAFCAYFSLRSSFIKRVKMKNNKLTGMAKTMTDSAICEWWIYSVQDLI